MNKKILTILLLIVLTAACATGLVSCADDKVYTVTWKNDDGEVLKTDENVKQGEIPVYGGATPEKQSDEQYSYVFDGWDPAVGAVSGNVTYTAKYTATVNKYTVVWKNHDGTVLETDNDVPYGETPVYNGATPQKAGTEYMSYVFTGWTPSIDAVTGNATYTAKFLERQNGNLVAGVDPVFSQDNKTVRYGYYPQTRVGDETLIAKLNTLTPSETNGWYLYNGEYYAKETAKVYNNEKYVFDDGTAIVNGTEYWFKCEPITWQVLSNEAGAYYLLSCKLLDAHDYYANYSARNTDGNTVYANNWQYSGIREWLNGEFFNSAFALNSEYIKETVTDNGASTTDMTNNVYACANTADKVYLPSYKDYLNDGYGFDTNAEETSSSRECKTTDYARARGAWYSADNSLKYNGSYWTRSPSAEYYYCAWNVNSAGYLSAYAVDGDSHCVRPCITLYFDIASK